MVNGSLLLCLIVKILLRPSGRRQQASDSQKLPGIQTAASVRAVQRLRHRLNAGERGCTVKANHLPGRIRLIQQAQHILRLCLGTQMQGLLLCLHADSLLTQQLQHARQFQRSNRFFKQFAH